MLVETPPVGCEYHILRGTPFPIIVATPYRVWQHHPNLVVSCESVLHIRMCSKIMNKMLVFNYCGPIYRTTCVHRAQYVRGIEENSHGYSPPAVLMFSAAVYRNNMVEMTRVLRYSSTDGD